MNELARLKTNFLVLKGESFAVMNFLACFIRSMPEEQRESVLSSFSRLTEASRVGLMNTTSPDQVLVGFESASSCISVLLRESHDLP